MSATYSTAAGNARLTACLNQTSTAAGVSVNGQTAGGGLLVIGTSALSGATGVLCTITLTGTPPFSISNKVATLLGVPLTATPSANGTAALAELRDSAGNTVASGLTVGTSGTDVLVSSTSIVTTTNVTVTAVSTITTQ